MGSLNKIFQALGLNVVGGSRDGKKDFNCDDAAFMRMMIRDILSKHGFEVAGAAENGTVAVHLYKELKPGSGHGHHTFEMEECSEGPPVRPEARLLCSAMGQQMMVMEAIQAGPGILSSALSTRKIIQAVEKALATGLQTFDQDKVSL